MVLLLAATAVPSSENSHHGGNMRTPSDARRTPRTRNESMLVAGNHIYIYIYLSLLLW
jgi:hypothetical protein